MNFLPYPTTYRSRECNMPAWPASDLPLRHRYGVRSRKSIKSDDMETSEDDDEMPDEPVHTGRSSISYTPKAKGGRRILFDETVPVPHRLPPTSVSPPSSHHVLARLFDGLLHRRQKAVPSGLEQESSDGQGLNQMQSPI